MGWTRLQLVQKAYEKIGLAHYVFDLQPEQLMAAAWEMDAMVAGWAANGIRINYPLTDSPNDIRLDQVVGCPDWCNEAIYSNLGVRIAGNIGKIPSPELKAFADMAYNNMANQCGYPLIERQLPTTMPRGAGTKPWRNFLNPFVWPKPPTVDAGPDGPIILE